jgi:hypothetical protein
MFGPFVRQQQVVCNKQNELLVCGAWPQACLISDEWVMVADIKRKGLLYTFLLVPNQEARIIYYSYDKQRTET